MISKLIAFLFILVVTYVGLIFLSPEFIDTYGSRDFNEKIRMIKRATELDRTMSSSGNLVDKATDIAKPYIDESKKIMGDTKEAIETVSTVVTEKKEQVKQAAESAQELYNKAQDTKSKIDTLTNFGTGK